MIDFGCKEFSIQEVIKCSLGITKKEHELLNFLLNSKQRFTTDELAKKLSLNKSTVQRGVKKLYEKKLLARGQVNLENGGYLFTYEICSKKKIEGIISEIIDEWTQRVKKELKKL